MILLVAMVRVFTNHHEKILFPIREDTNRGIWRFISVSFAVNLEFYDKPNRG
jgi:hypothetical protein